MQLLMLPRGSGTKRGPTSFEVDDAANHLTTVEALARAGIAVSGHMGMFARFLKGRQDVEDEVLRKL